MSDPQEPPDPGSLPKQSGAAPPPIGSADRAGCGETAVPPNSRMDDAATLPLPKGEQNAPTLAPVAVADETTLIPDRLQATELRPGARLRYFGDYELVEEIARSNRYTLCSANVKSLVFVRRF